MNSLIRHAATVLLGRGVIRIAQLMTFLVLARVLTLEEFGWFGVVTSGIMIAVPLATLGLRQAFAHGIGQARIEPGRAVGTTLALVPLLAAVPATALWLLYGSALPDVSAILTAAVILIACIGAISTNMLQGIPLGTGDIRTFATLDSIAPLLTTIGIVTLAVLGQLTLPGAILIYAVSFLPNALILLARAPSSRKLGILSLKDLVSMIAYGGFFAVNMFIAALNARSGVLVLEYTSGATAAGQLFGAMRLNDVLIEGAIAFGLVVFSRSVRASTTEASIEQGARIAAWVFWAFLLASLFVALFAETIILMLLGDQFVAAAAALQFLCLGLGPAAASKIIYPSIAGTGQPQMGLPVLLFSVVLNIALAFALTPQLGASGAAIAFSVSQIAVYLGYAYIVNKRHAVPLLHFFVPRRSDAKALARGAMQLLRREK